MQIGTDYLYLDLSGLHWVNYNTIYKLEQKKEINHYKTDFYYMVIYNFNDLNLPSGNFCVVDTEYFDFDLNGVHWIKYIK